MNKRARLVEVATRMAAIQAEVTDLDGLEAPSEDDATRASTLATEFSTLDAERAQLQADVDAVDAVRSAVIEQPSAAAPAFNAPNVIIRSDPFENIDMVQRGMVGAEDMRSRALAAIDATAGSDDDYAHRAAQLIDGTSRDVVVTEPIGIARHALLTGSPAYRSAFEKIIRFPEAFAGMLTGEESEALRAAMSTTVGNGGYAIPFLLDPTVVLSNSGSANPFRQISRIETGVSNKWQGLTSAGVTAEWKSEGAAAGDGNATFAQPSITAFLGDVFVSGSFEVLEDTNLANQLPALIGDGRDRLEDVAFVSGNGTSAPKGIVTAVAAVTTSRVAPTTGGAFTTASRADVDKVIEAVPPRFRSRSAWVANYSTYGIIRRMDTAGGSSFWVNLGANMPAELLGRPSYEAYSMTSTVTTGSNLLLAGDFSQYLIYDRIGTTLEYIPNLFDTTTGRPTGQRGWLAHFRTGADAVVPNAFRVLQL